MVVNIPHFAEHITKYGIRSVGLKLPRINIIFMMVECLQNMFNNNISNIAGKWQKAAYVNGQLKYV